MALNEYVIFTRTTDGASFNTLTNYGLILANYSPGTTEPVTRQAEVPGRSGYLDLTEALTGDVLYSNYETTFKFLYVSQSAKKEFLEQLATTIKNDLSGRKLKFVNSWDREYTYTGRATISYSVDNYKLELVVKLDTQPYKSKGTQTYKLNATGGVTFRLESGRKPVRPILECTQPCIVKFDGTEFTVGAGTYRLNFVLFTEGWNEIYINSYQFWNITWADVVADGNYAMTYAEAAAQGKRWNDLQRVAGDVEDVQQMWEDVVLYRWNELASKTWDEIDFRDEKVKDTTVYIQYDWEDL